MKRVIIIIVLALAGIFIQPFSPGIIDFIYRFAIFAALTYLVYATLDNEKELEPGDLPLKSQAPLISPHSIPDHEIINPDNWKIKDLLAKDDRSAEYLKDMFDIITGIVYPDNGWILYPEGNSNLVVHYAHSRIDLPGVAEADSKTFEVSGLLKILVENNDILIENNINGENNLLSFYKDSEYTPQSFMGIPLDYSEQERIYVVFDSKSKEHFNTDDSNIIAKLKKSCEIFFSNRIRAYSFLDSLKEKDVLLDFAGRLNSCKTVTQAVEQLAQIISTRFEASRLAISLVRKNEGKAVIRKLIGQKDEFPEQYEFALEEGLTGWVIDKNKPYLIEDMEKGEYFIPRYSKSEKTNFGLRCFLGLPFGAGDDVFGAVTLEHRSAGKYTDIDKQRLKTLVDVFSTTFERQKN